MEDNRTKVQDGERLNAVLIDQARKDSLISRVLNKISHIFSHKKKEGSSANDCEYSEEEKALKQELHEEIEQYYELKQELIESGKDPEQWYEEKIREIDADCTPEEIAMMDEVMDAVADEKLTMQAANLETIAQEIYAKQTDPNQR